MGFQILIIEDDKLLAKYLAGIISNQHRTFICHDFESATKAIKNISPDLVFTDLNLSNEIPLEGLKIVERCKTLEIPSVVLTSHGEEEVIREAFIKGCSHYLVKDEFESEVERIIRNTLGDPSEKYINEHVNTSSASFKSQIKFMLERSNNRDLPLLITGETGVGKTHIAKIIHQYANQDRPFIAKSLTELSDTVIESELFGHKKGAFTGATEDRKGWIELASGGTLFLDEIGTLSLSLQQKLLKVLEEKTITPVGSTEEIRVDFRLMSATCENLQEKIENGEFRVDFYFRIKGAELEIPSLRDRKEDIELFIKEMIHQQRRKIFFEDGALNALKNHTWSGNFRELKSLLQAVYSGNQSLITESQIRELIHPSQKPHVSSTLLTPKLNSDILENGLPEAIKKLEFEVFKKIVDMYGMKPNKICEALKISKSVFYRLQTQWEIMNGQF